MSVSLIHLDKRSLSLLDVALPGLLLKGSQFGHRFFVFSLVLLSEDIDEVPHGASSLGELAQLNEAAWLILGNGLSNDIENSDGVVMAHDVVDVSVV